MDGCKVNIRFNFRRAPQILCNASYLESAVASDVLSQLDPKLQPDIIYRLSTIENIQPEALKELEKVMEKNLTQMPH